MPKNAKASRHMIAPLVGTALEPALKLLQDEHDRWAGAVHVAVRGHSAHDTPMRGIQLKRIEVEVEGAAGQRQKLTEVINQLATIERLLAAMRWARSHLHDFDTVVIAHPTTSSRPRNVFEVDGAKRSEPADNDLILADAAGRQCWFEVSDVVGESDGNRKEAKERASLTRASNGVEVHRRYLVVSQSFCDLIWRNEQAARAKGYGARHPVSDLAEPHAQETWLVEFSPVEK